MKLHEQSSPSCTSVVRTHTLDDGNGTIDQLVTQAFESCVSANECGPVRMHASAMTEWGTIVHTQFLSVFRKLDLAGCSMMTIHSYFHCNNSNGHPRNPHLLLAAFVRMKVQRKPDRYIRLHNSMATLQPPPITVPRSA